MFLGIVVISIAISFGLRAAGDVAKPLRDIIDAVNAVTFKILQGILW